MAQDKPLPTLPGIHTTKSGAIENIPRRTTPNGAGGLIRRVSNMFSTRKKRPPPLRLSTRDVAKIFESRFSNDKPLSCDDEDDIRRPSGLGSAVSISSLPPSPFSPSHSSSTNTNNVDSGMPPYMPSGYTRARATSTPNLLRSLSLRSRGSKRKGRPRKNSGFSSREGGIAEAPVGPPTSQRTPLPLAIVHSTTTITSIPVETIALIFTYFSKSDIAKIARTCHLFLYASLTALYTHIDLDELTESQLEKFIALLASRRDFTDLVRSFSCSTWPQFFIPTSPKTPSIHTPVRSRSSYAGSPSPLHTSFLSPNPLLDPYIIGDLDPETQHHNTLLTATFTLAFQRMSNLTSLTLPSYDHDLLAYHTAFGLQNIRFLCSTMKKQVGKELFEWLDGQTNVVKLEFPNLVVGGDDFDFNLGGDKVRDGEEMKVVKMVRPATISGLLSVTGTVGSGGDKKTKYLVAPYLVPLNSASPPRSPLSPTSRNGQSPPPSPGPPPSRKLPPRPRSAAPSSPSYATFSEGSTLSDTNSVAIKSESPSLSKPHTPSTNSKQTCIASPSAPAPSSLTTQQVLHVNTSGLSYQQQQTSRSSSPLISPTLLPNLTTLHGPPSLIIALSSTPEHYTGTSLSQTVSPSHTSPSLHPSSPFSHQRRPLRTISINITTTLYSGLRPSMIMTRLIGTTRALKLNFGESVDRRSIEKVFCAAGSSLGGVRERNGCVDDEKEDPASQRQKGDTRVDKGEMKNGFTFGQGEWKGLIELNVGFVPGGPGSDEALHKMISSAVPRYPYLKVLALRYLPPSSLTPSSAFSPSLPMNSPSSGCSPHSPLVSPINFTPTPFTHAQTNGNGVVGVASMLPTPPHTVSPLPTMPSSRASFLSSTSTSNSTSRPVSITPTISVTPTPAAVPSFPPRIDSLKGKSLDGNQESGGNIRRKELSPPEKAYVRQWTKHCIDLERVVFLSGAEWVKSQERKS